MKLKHKILLLLLSFIFSIKISYSQGNKDYYQALFLLKFIKYTNWQKQPNYYSIGVVGNSAIIPYLKKITKYKRINGKRVIFNKVSSYRNIDKYSVLYIPKKENKKFQRILAKTKGKSILIVTEDGRLIYYKATMSFYEKNRKLKFKINIKNLRYRKLKVSSRLLSIGQVVNK